MTDLKGMSCLVTGGSRGIGRAIALELGRHGASVAVGYANSKDAAEEVVAEIIASGGQGFAFGGDVQDPASIEAAVAGVVERFGKIDVLVNNAGITRDRSLAKMSPDEWDAVVQTNLTSVFHMTSRVLPHMVGAGYGRIVNISSVIGLHGNFGQANYAASKAGIIGFSKSIAKELGSRNIRANVVAPGFIKTEMTEVLDPKVVEGWAQAIPLKRGGETEDVANCCVFLASDMASYITGQVIPVDGGML